MAKQNNNRQRALFVGPISPYKKNNGPNFAISSLKQMAKDAAVTAATHYVAGKMAEGQSPNPDWSGDWQGPKKPNGNGGSTPKGKGNNTNKGTPGGAIEVFKSSKPIGENNASYALSKAPNPKPISLNSGVKPDTYSNDYMQPLENACSPLHMTYGALQIPTTTTNPLYVYFTNNTCFDIQTRAQANCSFALDITNKLSANMIITAVNALITGLQTYFFYSSILSYESDPRNKNSGMTALRNLIDSQTISDLGQLGRRLEDTPCPPRLVEYIRYISGNFLSSMSQGSPLLKISLIGNLNTITSPSNASAALAALNSDPNTSVFALIRRAIPSWRIGKLYDCPPIPTYDKNFLNVFANLATMQRTAGVNVIPNSVANNDTAIPYVTYTNRLDGAAFALGGVYNTTTSEFYPGLMKPYNTGTSLPDNRYSYYSVGGVKQFYPVNGYSFLALSRQEATINVAGVNYQPHLFGTDKCQAVTGNALLHSAQLTLDFLFDTARLSPVGKVSSFNANVM